MRIKLPRRCFDFPADKLGGTITQKNSPGIPIPLTHKRPHSPRMLRGPSTFNLALRCTACRHSQLALLNLALVAGESARSVAKRFCLSKSSVVRHLRHLPRTLLEAKGAGDITRADMLMGQVCKLQRHTENLLARANAKGDAEIALRAIRELIRITDLASRIVQLHDNQNDQPRRFAEAPELVDEIVAALQPYPQARAAAAKALMAREKHDAA